MTRRAVLRSLVGLGVLSLAGCAGGDDPPRPVLASTNAYPDNGLLASTDWLADRIDDPNLRLLDCSSLSDYRAGHLPRASHVWWQDTIEINNPVYGMLTGAETRAEIVRATGITPDSTVVCYDDRGGEYAARILWMLHVQSFTNVRLLDGGRQGWEAAGHDLTGSSHQPPDGAIVPIQDESLIAHGADVLARLSEPGLIILDTRTSDERAETWFDRLRAGAIPGSRYLPRHDFLTADGYALLPPDELRGRLQAAGVPADAPEFIVYGLHGTLACLPYVALRALGYSRVRVYDGSWAEWGANADWPIEANASSSPT